ncbi:MAG: hypothetical protein GY827_10605 [Cytophagales bacterium]|nr:hypothetical protein [Cytophagales bacterium]
MKVIVPILFALVLISCQKPKVYSFKALYTKSSYLKSENSSAKQIIKDEYVSEKICSKQYYKLTKNDTASFVENPYIPVQSFTTNFDLPKEGKLTGDEVPEPQSYPESNNNKKGRDNNKQSNTYNNSNTNNNLSNGHQSNSSFDDTTNTFLAVVFIIVLAFYYIFIAPPSEEEEEEEEGY